MQVGTNQFKHISNLISVEVIKDSYNEVFDSRITTLVLEYPRLIHSEFKTHRVFSSNASSSRAIPVSKMIEQVRTNPAMPVRFGKNQAGMQDAGEYEGSETVKDLWLESSRRACSFAEVMNDHKAHKQVINRILEPYQFIRVCLTSTNFANWNYLRNHTDADPSIHALAEVMNEYKAHKQVINRILEPYQFIRVCLTSTNFANWNYLRNHTDADPTIHALAEVMQEAMQSSVPRKLFEGHWHVPFVKDWFDVTGAQIFEDENGNVISLEDALIISASCAAQTSYRKLDTSLEKAKDIYNKLIESKPCHSSPVEHSALVITEKDDPMDYFSIEGVTHIDKRGIPWSGNLHKYVQYRQLIKDNAVQY